MENVNLNLFCNSSTFSLNWTLLIFSEKSQPRAFFAPLCDVEFHTTDTAVGSNTKTEQNGRIEKGDFYDNFSDHDFSLFYTGFSTLQ